MAITRIGISAAGATTCTLPAGSAAGDIVVVQTGRNDAAGSDLASGWPTGGIVGADFGVVVGGSGSTVHGVRAAWKILTAADITANNVGTWTSATKTCCAVYRGSNRVVNIGSSAADSTVVTFPAGTSLASGSWQLAMAQHRNSGTNTLRDRTMSGSGYTTLSASWASQQSGAWDSNGTTSGLSSQTVTVTNSNGNAGWCFEVQETVPVVATPATGSIVLTGIAPAVASSISVTPSIGALSLAGIAPSVSVEAVPIIGFRSLNDWWMGFGSGSAPINTILTPGVGSLVLTGIGPSVFATANTVVTPVTGELHLTGISPSVGISDNVLLTPVVGSLVLGGIAPSVMATIPPAAGYRSINDWWMGIGTGGYPVGQNVSVSPLPGSLVLTGVAASVSISDNIVATPTTGSLALSGIAPGVTLNIAIVPGTASLALTGVAPIVVGSGVAIPTFYARLVGASQYRASLNGASQYRSALEGTAR